MPLARNFMSTMHQGYFSVGNTPSRKAELSSRIDDIRGADLLSVAEVTSLRSRLLFVDGQVFGRFGKAALHEIGRVGLDISDMSPLAPTVRQSLLWLRDRVLSGLRERSTLEIPRLFTCFWMVHAPMWWMATLGVGPRLVGHLFFQMAQC